MTNNLTHNIEIDESNMNSEVITEAPMTDHDAELIAKAIEFMFPLFTKVETTGVELIRVIGYGHEENNHQALISFVKKLDEKLLELPASDHVEYVNEQLRIVFDLQY